MGLTSMSAIYILAFKAGVHQEQDDQVTGLNAAVVAAASVLVKEWLYQTSMYII